MPKKYDAGSILEKPDGIPAIRCFGRYCRIFRERLLLTKKGKTDNVTAFPKVLKVPF